MKLKINKIIIAWIILFISTSLALVLTYLKLFPENNNIEEKPVNESSSNAIHNALKDITTNFNQNSNLLEYSENNNIVLKASLNNYSIFISYVTDISTTYEFTYNDLCLNITINNTEEEKNKFNIVYKFLIEAVQKRLNNIKNIDNIINEFLNTNINYDGLTKLELENKITYQINITKKIK